jgi:two-component system, NtrC family, nitrogen regulation sensor histidine kinase NtrY
MSLRARLLIALIALALVPTAIFSVFTLDQLDRATRRWFRPGVENALDAGREATQNALARLDAVALAGAESWAPRWPDATVGNRAMRAELRDDGLDFAQLYERRGTAWKLADQVIAERLIVPQGPDFSDLIGAALDSSRVLHTPRGALAAVAPVPPLARRGAATSAAAPERAVVVGFWIPPDFFDHVVRVSEGFAHYRALGVVVDVQRRFVGLLVLAVVLGVLAVALIAADRLARSAARPLSDLAGAIERVAGGELEARVTPAGARELRTLGEAFNAMAERLVAARERLREAEREEAWRRAASQIAHEIKNSLTPMRLSLARVERRLDAVPPADRDAVRQSTGILLQEIEDLARLANHFSEYARLPEPRFEPLDLAEVAAAAVGLHEGAAVTFGAEGAPLPVRGDRLLLSRALHNLVLNAREAGAHHPKDGPSAPIEVLARAAEGRAVVEVLDRGEGVPESVRGRVFEAYVSSKARGSGLGLALVRDIAAQHGGTVTLENREGGGACATLSLPLLNAARLPG